MSGQNPTYPKSFIYTRDAVQVATESPKKIEVYKDLRDGKLYYLDKNRIPVEINTGGGSGPGTNTNIANADLVFDGVHVTDLNSFSWALFDATTTGTLIAGFVDTFDVASGTGMSAIAIGSGSSYDFHIPIGGGQLSTNSMFIGGSPGSYNPSGYEFSTQDTGIGKYALASVGIYDYISAGATQNNKENTAVGYQCLTNYGTSLSITDQEGQNTAVGYRALTSLEGSDGVFFGSFNVALGGRAGEDLTTGDTNIIVGHNAAWEATNAWGNTLIGFEIADGASSGTALDDGYLNVAIGYQVDIDESTNSSTVIGNYCYIAPSAAGSGEMPIYSILIGDNSNALVSTDPLGVTTSQDTGIIAIGVGNLFQDIDDGGVVAVGSFMNIVESAPTGSDGIYTTAVGHKVEIYGWWNDAFGFGATIGDGVTDSAYNTAIGRNSSIYGEECSSIGQNTQIGDTGNACAGSTAIGYGALTSANSAHNTAVGSQALWHMTSGSENTALGRRAGRYYWNGSADAALATTTNGVYIGDMTRANADSMTNEIVIGTNSIGSGSYTTTIGSGNVFKFASKQYTCDHADGEDGKSAASEAAPLKLPAYSIIKSISVTVDQLSNLGTFNVALYHSTDTAAPADDTALGGTPVEVLGAGASDTCSGNSASAVDIALGSGTVVKQSYYNGFGGAGLPVGTADRYIHVGQAGTSNGDTDPSTAGLISICVEYVGLD